MPNDTEHKASVSGPANEIQRFFNLMFAQVDDKYEGKIWTFDFNKVIPMPKYMSEITDGSVLDDLLWAFGKQGKCKPEIQKIRDMFGRQSPLDYPQYKEAGVKNAQDLIAYWMKKDPKEIDNAELGIRAINETGYKSWYDWSCEHWGTKWNAYSVTVEPPKEGDTSFTFTFITAWSSPEPVLRKLAEMFPEITLESYCLDEGFGFAGLIELSRGAYRWTDLEADEVYYQINGEYPH